MPRPLVMPQMQLILSTLLLLLIIGVVQIVRRSALAFFADSDMPLPLATRCMLHPLVPLALGLVLVVRLALLATGRAWLSWSSHAVVGVCLLVGVLMPCALVLPLMRLLAYEP